MHGELDLANALDLDQAVGIRAAHLKDLGAPSRWTCGARSRSGSWPAASSPLTCNPATPRTRGDRAEGPPRRPVTLYLHLHQSAIESGGGIGQMGNTRSPVTVEQIRDWCGLPEAQVTVKPVIDLADHVHVEA